MKILEVLDTYYPKFDGPTQVVTFYAKSLMKYEGAEVEVLVPKYKKYIDDQPFKVNRVKSMAGPEGYATPMPGFDGKMKRYIKSKNFDIMHFHSPFMLGRFAAKFGKKQGIPTIFTFHTKFRDEIQRNTKVKLFQKIAMGYVMKTINLADHVIAVSDGAAETLREYGYKKEIKVIRNGTDLTYPDNAAELINKVNEVYGLEKEHNVFLSVGRIVENKQIDLVLEALKIVKERGGEFKFLIVGAGPYEETLKQNVSRLGLNEHVIFTGRILDRQFLTAHYLRSDLFMFPSTFDTASLAPLEAAALKLPTLMTRGCATAETIADNRNGLLEEQDAQKWADKIMYVMQNKDQLAILRENAYKEVYRSWDDVIKEVYAYYEKVISEFKTTKGNK